jgi:hypothetical protein
VAFVAHTHTTVSESGKLLPLLEANDDDLMDWVPSLAPDAPAPGAGWDEVHPLDETDDFPECTSMTNAELVKAHGVYLTLAHRAVGRTGLIFQEMLWRSRAERTQKET